MTAASLPYRIGNHEEIGRNMLRLFGESMRALSTLLDRPDAKLSPYSAASEISDAAETVAEIARIWTSDPVKLVEVQGALARSYLELWSNSVRRLFGEGVEPLVAPEPSDNRFKDPEWSSDPLFRFLQAGQVPSSTRAHGGLIGRSGWLGIRANGPRRGSPVNGLESSRMHPEATSGQKHSHG